MGTLLVVTLEPPSETGQPSFFNGKTLRRRWKVPQKKRQLDNRRAAFFWFTELFCSVHIQSIVKYQIALEGTPVDVVRRVLLGHWSIHVHSQHPTG